LNSSSTNKTDLKNLFAEIGSEEKLEDILKKFYTRMSKDILVGFFFSGKDLEKIVGQQRDFLLRAMGEKRIYKGRSPKTAHRGLPPILKGHFDRRLKLLGDVLKEEGLSAKAVTCWKNFEESFRQSIVKV
jgi:truncated hemoglobin YjbI